MADIKITKILVRRGPSVELPHDLDSGELAFSTDEGRLFIGSHPRSGQPQYDRTEFPYRNIEILTENTPELFATMHGQRMRDGGGPDYYTARLEPQTIVWNPIRVTVDATTEAYRIMDANSVSAFIDYAVTNPDGVPIRMGNMQLTYWSDTAAEPNLVDNGSYRRDLGIVSGANYDPATVFGRVDFRFRVEGPLNARYLSFQYRNYTDDAMNIRFKVSRPEAIFYDGMLPPDEVVGP
jgi:hypothetical protein